ncbi:MAG TPA: ATP-binding protein [Bryobacteraceae bacterium]|nr:ATP-binding protein [Bryobacteraceae bacterium]
MEQPTRLRVGLAGKLAVCLVASTAALFALFGYFNLRAQRRHSEEMVMLSAGRITDVIQRSTRYEMLHNDRQALYNVIKELGSEPGIRRIRIFNKEGRISFSTDAAEVNRVVDKRAEACYGCHAQSAPLVKLNRPDRARIFPGRGERLLGVIRPIENEASCSGCHPAEQRVLGVIDANLSLAAVDSQIAQHRRDLIVFMAITLAMIWLVSVIFVWGVVYRPVKALIDGTHRVADGDLDYRLSVRNHDELSDLAESFNKMTAEVSGAHAEIEERVRRKTEELDQAHRSLLSSEKMASIGKLAATVAHEVNNPLFGILTYARLTLKEVEKGTAGSPQTMIEQLRIIERESKRCGEIMRNLLTFARQAPSHRQPNDLNTLIGRALVLVRHQAELLGIELRSHLQADMPTVSCDAGQIQQAVLVLLVNATEAMPQGGLLEVSTEMDAAAGEARIRVRDNGMGIPPEVLSQIFDPFFTTKEDQQRTGLGLAVARSVIEQHGGEIAVESTLGKGTEFVIRLPAAKSAALEPAAAGSAPLAR